MSTKTEENGAIEAAVILAIPALIVGTVGTMVLVGAWRAFVISKLYEWFLVPLGVPLLNWWHVWGLLLIYSTVLWAYKKPEPSPKDGKALGRLFAVLFTPVFIFAFALLLGWLIKTWGLS